MSTVFPPSVRTLAPLVVIVLLGSLAPTHAQQGVPDEQTDPVAERALAIDGPPPPALPQAAARDADGRVTARAVPLDEPLQLDGLLTEPLYETVEPISDFVQSEPQYDAPASQRTEVWLSFDEEYVYVSVRAWETDLDRMVANEMRRDSFNVMQNDNFGFMFDTFYDRRSGVLFQFNPLGGRMDGQLASEGNYNGDWNPIWELTVGRFEGGWTAEAAIPFKSLSYQPGQSQIWGFNARRRNRWRNEMSYLMNPPAGMSTQGIAFPSFAATVVGIEAPPSSRTLDIKPYLISDITSDVPSDIRNEVNGDIGLDVRYALTQSLSADFTYNTDFAQVEADEQQVNLTRFSLFFPEKREFFLENQGLFNFGGAGGFGGGNTTPRLFYSRRIGLESGREIPILTGGRLTGRVGKYNVGVINIQTKAGTDRNVPATNFTVARVRRDILRRSAIGAILTSRSDTLGGRGSAQAYGVDAAFAFYENLEFQAYFAQTRNPGVDGNDTSFRARMEYDSDLWGVTVDRLGVGANFDPSVGFMRRRDVQRTFVQSNYTPRPASLDSIRQFTIQGQFQYAENNARQLETREFEGQFQIEFENSDELQVQYADGYELLPLDFEVARGVTVPEGGYTTDTAQVSFTLGQQRVASGTWSVSRSQFYGGHNWSYGYSSGRVRLHPQLAVEPGISVNRASTPFGDFTTELYTSRVTYTVTPLMFVSGLLQYNSARHSMSTNFRLRWEYQPGSELFVVYNEGRDTNGTGLPDLKNRALVVKINRLFRF
jgi:hypothetical protein